MANTGDVYKALKTRWEADSTLDGIGGPYRDMKPPGASPAFPYCVFKSLPAIRNTTTSSSTIWQLAYSFNVYDVTQELCEAHLDKIQAAFSDWSETLADNKGNVLVNRDVTEEVVEEDEEVCRGTLTYRLLYRRPR